MRNGTLWRESSSGGSSGFGARYSEPTYSCWACAHPGPHSGGGGSPHFHGVCLKSAGAGELLGGVEVVGDDCGTAVVGKGSGALKDCVTVASCICHVDDRRAA